MEKRKITERQKRFIDYYIETGSPSEAARLAGYKHPQVQGNQNLEKLRPYIDKKLAEKDNQRIASQDEVLRFYTAVLRNDVTEEIPVLSGDGFQKITKKGALIRDRLKAAELLGKRYGMDKPVETEPETVRIILERRDGNNP